jgi:hypothetical protein
VASREVFQAALALPPEERAELIEELEASLPAEVDDTTLAVINERIARAIAGEPGIPGEEVFAEARRR